MNYLEVVQKTLKQEAQAIERIVGLINEEQVEHLVGIFKQLKVTGGNLIFTGVGKSGLIGQKLASTFSSLGLPSYLLHPIEALHGDLGRVTQNDAVVLISKSGSTEEISKMLPFISIPQERTIGLLGNVNSALAQKCQVVLDCSVEKEACLNNLAPTTSSTVALAVGDALAVLYESLVGLSKEGFAINHPAGFLGKSLSLRVRDLMVSKQDCACLGPESTLKQALVEMTTYPLGICVVVENEVLKGLIVEGDIRRLFSDDENAIDKKLIDIMNKNPIKTGPDSLAYDALELMENREKAISVLPVMEDEKFVGVLRLHDLLKEGFSFKK